MTTLTVLHPEPGSMQARISENVLQLLTYRQVSRRALAAAIGVDPAGITARMKGETDWRTSDIETAARTLNVPWPWLSLTLPELMTNVIQQGGPGPGLVTEEYADTSDVSRGMLFTDMFVTRTRDDLAAAA